MPAVSERRDFRIFISSPADVRPERLIAARVVERLAREFSHHYHVHAVLWEREPLVAGAHFQERIVPPRETDIAVFILWSRMGVPLPEEKYLGPLTRKRVTGTEWEFEDALSAYRQKQRPEVLLYRKKVELTGSFDDEEAVRERLTQKKQVEDFLNRWTRSADGQSFTAASWEFDSAAGFEELLEHHLRELMRRQLSGAGEGAGEVRWHQGSPFRGLESFELEHAAVFFGRSHARNELRELLARLQARGCVFLLVMGASGSGKSSLVKAGLLADLKVPGMIGHVALCRHAIMRPSDGDDILTGLAAALFQPTALPELAALRHTIESFAGLLRADAPRAAALIREALAAAGKASQLAEHAEARLAIIVDQLEELFTRDTLDAAARQAFVAALEVLAKSGDVWIVATLRSDFFHRLEGLPALLALSAGEARYLLPPPQPAEIAQMIRQPAREAGLRFEADATRGIGLDEVIRQAASRAPGTLPLLSFLLDQLWQARTDGLLSFAAYGSLGGLEGSLGRRADEVFAGLPPEVQKALPEVLRLLVTVAPGGTATARTAPLTAFPPGTPRRALVDALLDPKARLLVAHSDERTGAQVRVAHEALLSHWGTARKHIEDDARDLQLRARLEQAADLWRAAAGKERASLLLAPGLQLAQARDLVARWHESLDPAIVEFVAASRRAARRRTVRLVSTIVGATLALPLLAGATWLVMVWQGVRTVERELPLVLIKGGCYLMGSPPTEEGRDKDETPQHEVCVKDFQLQKFEVTQKQWRAVMLGNPSQYPGDDRPVENVSWDDIQVFLGRMNRFGSRTYRLPTEAEWEYADRAGTTTAYFWGATLLPDACEYANINDQSFERAAPRDPIAPMHAHCDDGDYQTATVGKHRPNPFGLYDMQGNVWEWVEDHYDPDYANAPTDGSAWINPRTPRGDRIIRGASWHTVGRRVRSAQREQEPPDYRIGYIGFRMAVSLNR